ncbi:MAG: amidohydrolase family protein [Gemmatimonadaceae bacterium]
MLALAFALTLAADTTSYVVLNHGRPAGEMLVVTAGDSVIVKYHHVDRQRGPRVETRYRLADSEVVGGATWQLPLYGAEPTPRGEPLDRFEVVGDSVLWQVRDSTRGEPRARGGYYRLRSSTAFDQALLARHLLRQPGRSSRILPTGSARLAIVADTVLTTRSGPQRMRLAMIRIGSAPVDGGVWLDDRNALVASQVGWFVTVQRGNEELLPVLRAIEIGYRNAQGIALAAGVAPPPAGVIAIVNGDVFDSERGVMMPRTTVVVRGDRVIAIGPSAETRIPRGATVIDAVGKTVMPGLWDMHTHFQLTSQSAGSIAQLANGITTIRDLAADIDVAVSHRDRADAGLLASPRAILGGFIEGPGRWAGPSEAIAHTEEEARAWVARYDSLGFRQIKLYNLVHPDLVPAIADEAHRRGMRLSGHVPRGMSTQTAVRLGFDEINHAAFLFSTFYPDSLYAPVMRAYSVVSQIVAPHVNVDGPEVTAMIDLFRERGTVIDGTWNLWLSTRGAAASATLGIPYSATTDLARRSDANYLRMLRRLYDAGVPIVPGTDGSSYHAELELYERAGIPAARVLQMATIVSARAMKDDAEYGSIAPGKVADIIIVNGRPAERVADLRNVERVMRAGRLYESSALRAALSGAP